MKFQIELVHNEHGVVEVTTSPMDLRRWEQVTKQKLTDLTKVVKSESGTEVMLSLGIEDMLVMGWAFCTRKGLTVEAFTPWAEQVDSIEFVGVEEVNPTQQAQSEEHSAN